MNKSLVLLHEMLPSTRSIKDGFYLTVDAILIALGNAGLEVPLRRIEGVEDFDLHNFDDDQIAEMVFEDRWEFHRGLLVVHTPACSRHDLPDFECPASELREFITNYGPEMLFDGDVIFIAPESRTLTLFHHEGAFGHFVLPRKLDSPDQV